MINKRIDRRQLLKAMIDQPKGYQKLIQWLFPLVKSIILHKLMKTTSKAVMLEVPLLFQGHLDAYCDVIIGVETNPAIQKRRLQQRVGDLAERLWILNERNHYHDFITYIDIRLNNDGSLASWQQQAKQTLTPFIKYL